VLGPDDQERFSRHLLLDHLGGRGQERLCAGAVAIDLPESFSLVAQSCARALAAAGVGRLMLRGGWASAAMRECRRLAPGADLVLEGHPVVPGLVSPVHEGGQVLVSIGHQAEGHQAAHATGALALSPLLPGSAADQMALGALVALEALKLLAHAGRPAPSPLEIFPRAAP
jgi:hypothetical protein